MTLADEMDPIPCIGLCTEVIEQNLVTAAKNIPSIDDSPEEAAKKYAILGRCLRSVKEHTKEALKSVQTGSDGAAYLIMEGQKHHSLSEYDGAQITITAPDGESVQTSMKKFNEVAEAVQKDPSIVDRAEGAYHARD